MNIWQELKIFKAELSKTSAPEKEPIPQVKDPRKGKGLKRFQSMNSLKESENLSIKMKQLELPSIRVTNRNQFMEGLFSTPRGMNNVRSCQAFYYNVEQSETGSNNWDKRNLKRLKFIKRKQIREQNGSENGSKEMKQSVVLRVATGPKDNIFLKKPQTRNPIPFQLQRTSLKHLMESHQQPPKSSKNFYFELDESAICMNCKKNNQIMKRLKERVKIINSAVSQMKIEYEESLKCIIELKKQILQKINALAVESQKRENEAYLNRVLIPQKVQQFIDQVSVDIDKVFEKEFSRSERRERSDIGKIIKNTLSRFEREELTPKQSQFIYKTEPSLNFQSGNDSLHMFLSLGEIKCNGEPS